MWDGVARKITNVEAANEIIQHSIATVDAVAEGQSSGFRFNGSGSTFRFRGSRTGRTLEPEPCTSEP